VTRKKKTVMDQMVDSVKEVASSIGDFADGTATDKVFERIVPIPHVNVYSELPFALVDGHSATAPPKRSSSAAKKKSARKVGKSRK
jgi:hypothetical protein